MPLTRHPSLPALCLLIFWILTGSCRPAAQQAAEADISVRTLADFPCTAGKDLGVAAPFAGIHDGMLIVAGGCNFPGTPAAEGGAKVYYAEAYALDITRETPAAWKGPFPLPSPVAYGTSVTTPEGIICMGGNNEKEKLSRTFRIRWNAMEENIAIDALPSLPASVDNAAGAAIGHDIYLVGGNKNGIPSSGMFRLSLDKPEEGWIEMPPVPGPARLQAVAAPGYSKGKTQLFVASGYTPSIEGSEPCIQTDIMAFDPDGISWEKVANIPSHANGTSRSYIGGCAVAMDSSHILFLGGTRYDRFLTALQREKKLYTARIENKKTIIDSLQQASSAYLSHPMQWYRFNPELYCFDTEHNTWARLGEFPQSARAGAQAVWQGNKLFVICGEIKPGIRTPEVNQLIFSK